MPRPHAWGCHAVVIAFVVACLWGADTASAGAVCSKTFAGSGRSSHAEGSDDVKKYGSNVPADLARSRAIADWQANVTKGCPRASTKWSRARGKSVSCEGTPGHTDCSVSAVPGRRLFGL
jgi:hypothetical protein